MTPLPFRPGDTVRCVSMENRYMYKLTIGETYVVRSVHEPWIGGYFGPEAYLSVERDPNGIGLHYAMRNFILERSSASQIDSDEVSSAIIQLVKSKGKRK